MVKKNLTQEMLDSGMSFKDLGFEFVPFLPYVLCEECATGMISRTVIVDDDDVIYYRHNRDAIENFYFFKYFTSADVDEFDNEEGINALYDFARKDNISCGSTNMYLAGWRDVEAISFLLYDAMEKKLERKTSVGKKIEEAIDKLFSEEAIKRYSKSPEVSETLIDAFELIKKNEEKTKEQTALSMFAKK